MVLIFLKMIEFLFNFVFSNKMKLKILIFNIWDHLNLYFNELNVKNKSSFYFLKFGKNKIEFKLFP